MSDGPRSPSLPEPADPFDLGIATWRFARNFDDLRYRGVPLVELSQVAVYQLLRGARLDPPSWSRRFLGTGLGRIGRRLRSWRRGRTVADWTGRGVLLDTREDRGVLQPTLQRLRQAPRVLLSHPTATSSSPVLRHFCPGRRHPSLAGEVGARYSAARDELGAAGRRLPEDHSWLATMAEDGMDLLDAAQVFWEVSGALGGVTTNACWPEMLAFGLEGTRGGRTVAALQHGYLYAFAPLSLAPAAFGVHALWDRWVANAFRRAGRGPEGLHVPGHYGYLDRALGDPGGAPPALPRVLLLAEKGPPGWEEALGAAYRQVLGEARRWRVVWKLHPADPPPRLCDDESLLARGAHQLVRRGSVYPLIRGADLVVGAWSSVLAEAYLAGRRVLVLTSRAKSVPALWARQLGIPTVAMEGEVGAAVGDALATPAPPAPRAVAGEPAWRALAELLDQVLAGHYRLSDQSVSPKGGTP